MGCWGVPCVLGDHGQASAGPSLRAQACMLLHLSFIAYPCYFALQKGYGLGSGISLFIATNICESIMWKAFRCDCFMAQAAAN